MKRSSLLIQVGFYLFAGFNHFRDPEFYYGLIPDYLGDKEFINVSSGVIEMILAIGLLVPRTRKIAASAIIAMLIAFIPSHVYFIQIGSCIEGGLCVSEWIGWFRLIIVHPLLIFWALVHSK